MALSPDELMRAFIEYPMAMVDDNDDVGAETPTVAAVKRPYVAFGLRCRNGPGRGYVRIWGPSANPQNPGQSHVIIELWNGVVGVRAPLHQHIPGTVARISTATIVNDPLGYSCGPSFGEFTHAIPSNAMGSGAVYPDARSVVTAVLSAFAAAGMPW